MAPSLDQLGTPAPATCPLACSGKDCRLEPAGPGELPQSGDTYLPATRYTREGCPVQAVATLPTGEGWRPRT